MDKVIAHFSSARNVVQKVRARLGWVEGRRGCGGFGCGSALCHPPHSPSLEFIRRSSVGRTPLSPPSPLSLSLHTAASSLQAQLGDSWLSPDVGYLLLHTLCPALYGLVEDGLKPFQKDVITGQRRNSPWSVVEASVKTGRCGKALGQAPRDAWSPFPAWPLAGEGLCPEQ